MNTDNGCLRTTGPERGGVTVWCRKLQNEEFHNLYSTNTVGMTKPRRMRWADHVACMGKITEIHTTLSLENLNRRDWLGR
jgi:hypothetical protein